MILHHFTRPELLDAILRDGLKASCAIEENDMTNGVPVVWLTARDTLVPSLKTRKIMLSRGIISGPRCSNLPDATVCLRVVIGSHSRRLAHFLSWLRKHPHYDPDDPLLRESMADDWVHFGDIPPAKLTVFKHVPRTRPYWKLKLHDEWLETQATYVLPREVEADILAGRAGPSDYVEAMQELERELGGT